MARRASVTSECACCYCVRHCGKRFFVHRSFQFGTLGSRHVSYGHAGVPAVDAFEIGCGRSNDNGLAQSPRRQRREADRSARRNVGQLVGRAGHGIGERFQRQRRVRQADRYRFNA